MGRASLSLRTASCAALFLTSTALFSACGDDSEDPSKSVKLEDYASTFQDTLCGWMVKCGQMPDAGTCARVVAPDKAVAQGVASVVFGDLEYDPVAGKACTDALKASECELVYGYGYAKNVKDACAKVFTNLAANGGNCFADSECQSGFCKPPMDCKGQCCVGACDQIPQNIPIGTMCDPNSGNCVPEAYCDGDAKVCTKRVEANQTCKQADACIDGYSCDTGGSQTCFKKSKSGEACNPTLAVSPCLSFNDYCEPTTSKCSKLPQPGQPCTAMGNGCARDASCNGEGMTCKLLPIEGEDCAGTCLGSLHCTSTMDMPGVCEPLGGSTTCVPP